MVATAEMAADAAGLVHGGFLFGLADHAAMLAVNHPLVVLAGAEVRCLHPVQIGDVLTAHAEITSSQGRRFGVECRVAVGPREVFRGTFDCVVPKQHVLAREPAS